MTTRRAEGQMKTMGISTEAGTWLAALPAGPRCVGIAAAADVFREALAA